MHPHSDNVPPPALQQAEKEDHRRQMHRVARLYQWIHYNQITRSFLDYHVVGIKINARSTLRRANKKLYKRCTYSAILQRSSFDDLMRERPAKDKLKLYRIL